MKQNWTPEERQARRDLATRRFDDLVDALGGLTTPAPLPLVAVSNAVAPGWLAR